MIAEVARDLHQALLTGGIRQHPRIGRAQEPLAREFEHGVVRGTGPREIAAFHFRLNLAVAAGHGPHPQPRQNNVDRQVSDARFAEERLRSRKPRGVEGQTGSFVRHRNFHSNRFAK